LGWAQFKVVLVSFIFSFSKWMVRSKIWHSPIYLRICDAICIY